VNGQNWLVAESGGRTVLLVEDDDSLRLLCRLNLELDGHRVLEAPSVPRARKLLASEAIDFVVLDVHVGSESGYDLIDTIREQQRAAIALLTGSAEVGPHERDRVDLVLSKPFELGHLTGAIDRLTGAGVER
jgi:DNA-binding response OmpR family regulator